MWAVYAGFQLGPVRLGAIWIIYLYSVVKCCKGEKKQFKRKKGIKLKGIKGKKIPCHDFLIDQKESKQSKTKSGLN